jgi:selenide,water dikinase
MLPGYIAGKYTYDETHIDLQRLAAVANARFVLGVVCGVLPDKKELLVCDRENIAYDLLSMNTGSTPENSNVPGAEGFATKVKPVPEFLHVWDALLEKQEQGALPKQIAVVGGGAAGVELSFSMRARLSEEIDILLIEQGNTILPSHHWRVRKSLTPSLQQANIELVLGTKVESVHRDKIVCSNGKSYSTDYVFWVTRASAPSWLNQTGLALDDRGFIKVSETLESVSHPGVFAAGDVSSVGKYSLPKSGVYAVRQAPFLYRNIAHSLANERLEKYIPQKRFLGLIGTGNGKAVWSRGVFSSSPSSLIWQIKDYIDRRFMNRFERLADEMPTSGKVPKVHGLPVLRQEIDALDAIRRRRCNGCAAKVASDVLGSTMDRLLPSFIKTEGAHNIRVNLCSREDAAIFKVPENYELVQSVDYLPAFIKDPYVFGRIALLHAMSDIFAMGAQAHSAHVTAILPLDAPRIVEEGLFQLLSGINRELNNVGAELIGGHTAYGPELAVSISANGLLEPSGIQAKGGLREGQTLILAKALGTGIVFAGHMQAKARGRWIDQAVESMLVPNSRAADIFSDIGATALTDVTGFGLLGHLLEMLRESNCGVRLSVSALPVIDGAKQLLRQNIMSSLAPSNALAMKHVDSEAVLELKGELDILYDPQTSGGLLAAVPREQAAACVDALRAAGYSRAAVVGEVVRLAGSGKPIVLC